MKKALLVVVFVATFGSAKAVTTTLTALATSSGGGLVTEGATDSLVSGNLYLFSSATELNPSSLEGILGAVNPLAFFVSKLGFDPGQVRGPVAFTNGTFISSSAATEVGVVGNKLYMLIVSTDGSYIGAFQGLAVPSLGAVLMNSATMIEDLVGTSTLQSISGTNSGFQLVAVPEPSMALLGLLSLTGLIRRRR